MKRAPQPVPPAAVAALREKALDGVLLYSKRSAEIFYRLAATANVDASHTKAFCLSAGVGDIARAAGAQTHVAEFPDDAHLYACIDAVNDR